MTGFSKVPFPLLYAAAAVLTTAATRQGGPKFGSEHLRHLSVCIATAGEERDELLRGVTPVHEEGGKAAVLTTDVAGQALHLSLVIFPSGAVVFYVSLDTGYEWNDAI